MPPTFRAWTKAIRNPNGSPGYHPKWILARRGWFQIFSDRIECGDLVIRHENITDAVLYETKQWFIPVSVLAIVTAEETWQFGFNPWVRIADHLRFSFRRERIRLHYSVFSLVVRLILLAAVCYALWGRIFHAE